MIRTPKKSPHHHADIKFVEQWKGSYSSLGYEASRVASYEGRSYISYSGIAHTKRDRARLIAQSRNFMRNNAIYKGMIEQAVLRTVGNGFKLQVRASNKKAVTQIEDLWRQWFRRPEIRNLLSGAELSRLILRELIVAGDTCILKTNKGLLQGFEAEQLTKDSNGYVNGINKDKLGRPVKFYLCPWKTYCVDQNNGNEVKAADVIYLANTERWSQVRGVPALQSAFPMIHRINDVCDSEAIAWQMLARLAVAIIRKDSAEQAYDESREDPNKSADDLEGDLATRLIEFDKALIFHGDPGEEVHGIERNIPGDKFTDSLRMFLRILGLPIGLPLELILLDWTQSNYSQSRAVLEQAYENFLQWQNLLEDCFYRPTFEWKLEQWQSGNLIGNVKSVESEWIKPTFPWIDQVKEAQAQSNKVERGFITHGHVCKSLNMDRDEIVERRSIEIADAIERAKKIEEKTGEKVPWQIFAGLAPPKSANPLSKKPSGDDEQNSEEEN